MFFCFQLILLLIKFMNLVSPWVNKSFTNYIPSTVARWICLAHSERLISQDKLLLPESDPAVEAYFNHLKNLADNKADSDMSGAWTSLRMNVAEKRA